MSQQVVIAKPQHASHIAEFQVKMALETQNFNLNKALVSKAVQYFISLESLNKPSKLGFYLVRLVEKEVAGSLLITFQTQKKWWIQSVYVRQQYRRQGHFTSLFNKCIELAKQNKVQSVRLYAESTNQRAKQAYFKLGMQVIKGKFYSYDFVYGTVELQKVSKGYKFEERDHINEQMFSSLKFNILENKSSLQNKNIVVIRNQQQEIGYARFFEEFSDWRFGIIRYISQLYVKQSFEPREVLSQLITYLVESSSIKIAAVRIIASKQFTQTIKGGHLQHYDILQIDLKQTK